MLAARFIMYRLHHGADAILSVHVEAVSVSLQRDRRRGYEPKIIIGIDKFDERRSLFDVDI